MCVLEWKTYLGQPPQGGAYSGLGRLRKSLTVRISSSLRFDESSFSQDANIDFFFSGFRLYPIWFLPVGGRRTVDAVDFQGVNVDFVLFQNWDELLLTLSQVDRCEAAPAFGFESCDQNFQELSLAAFDFVDFRAAPEPGSPDLNGFRLGIFQLSCAATGKALIAVPIVSAIRTVTTRLPGRG